MISQHVHDALDQVKRMQELILQKRLFRGYSGRARILSGFAALAGAIAMDCGRMKPTAENHLVGWGAVLVVGIILNYSSLLYWFFFDADVRRNPIMLKPALDAIPALGLGGVLSVTFIVYGLYDLLPGMWMAVYGLAQAAYRLSLPRGIYLVGIAYMIAGSFFLIQYDPKFTNPWPMGLAFFLGELVGGIVLIRQEIADHARIASSQGDAQ